MKQFLWVMALIVGITTPIGFEALSVPLVAAQAPVAQAHFTFPDTPAAKQLQAWLAAFNSGDRATIQAFVKKVMTEDTPPGFVDQTIQMRNQMGGFDFQKVEQSTDVRFAALAKARVGGQLFRITVDVERAEPHRIASIWFEPVPRTTSTRRRRD